MLMYEVDFAIIFFMPKHRNHKKNKHRVYIPNVSEDQTGEIRSSMEEPEGAGEEPVGQPAEEPDEQSKEPEKTADEPAEGVEPADDRSQAEEIGTTEEVSEPAEAAEESSDAVEAKSEEAVSEPAEAAEESSDAIEAKPEEAASEPAEESSDAVEAKSEEAVSEPAAEESASESVTEEPKPESAEDTDDLDPDIDAVDTVPIREIFIRKAVGKKRPFKERKPKEPKEPKAPEEKEPEEDEPDDDKPVTLPRIKESFTDSADTAKKTGRKKPKGYNILFVPEDGRRVKSVRTSAEAILAGTFVLAGILTAIVVYIVWNSFSAEEYKEEITALHEEIVTLSEDKIVLEADIERLEQELSNATTEISAKETQAQADTEIQALQAIPSALPINSGALPSDYDKEKHWITIDAASGTHVVATGDGTVTYVGESAEAGGYRVTVEHGNGYETNYYCQSFPVVTQGAKVSRGTTLFVIVDTDKLIYQIKYEDDFIDPYTVLNIAG